MTPRIVNLIDVKELQARRGRRAGGAKGQASGKRFEARLNRSHAILRETGEAFVVQNHVATVRTRDASGRTQLRATGRGFVDYSGWMREASGSIVPVCFDAKVITGKATYSLLDLQDHQQKTLRRQLDDMLDWCGRSRGHAKAFLLFYCDELETLWLAGTPVLRQLAAGQSIAIRRKHRNGTVEHLLPHAPAATLEQMARGLPEIPWLGVARIL